MSGQPVSVGSKIEASLDACQAEQVILPPQITANIKANNQVDVTVQAACLNDADYRTLMATLGLTDEDTVK